MADVQMPQLGETVTEGTITRWFKQVGDPVAEDEVLFEVSTDKVDSEVPSPVAGYLVEIRAPEGETVDVGAVIAVVSDTPPAGGTDGSGAGADAAVSSAGAAVPNVESAPVESPPTAGAPTAPAEPPSTTPAAQAPADSGSGRSAAPPTGDGVAAPGASGVVTSPLVRSLAADAGLDLRTVTGSGAGGRVTRADVERLIEAERRVSPSGSAGPTAPTPLPAGLTAPAAVPVPAPASGGRANPKPPPVPRSVTGDTVVPMTNIRRRTAEHMVQSKSVSPHAVTVVEVDYEHVESVRRRHKETWRAEEGFGLTYLPFIARAVIDALRDFPYLNASVGEGELILHNEVNLAIAVDLDFGGLLAPVVQRADGLRLRALARAFQELAERARSKKLSADDITGGTFTVTNNGTFGPHLVIPIISQPQVAIVSTDAVTRRPVVVTTPEGGEAIAIHSVGLLTMAWDHRAIDGAYAGAFLAEVRDLLQTRDWEAEL